VDTPAQARLFGPAILHDLAKPPEEGTIGIPDFDLVFGSGLPPLLLQGIDIQPGSDFLRLLVGGGLQAEKFHFADFKLWAGLFLRFQTPPSMKVRLPFPQLQGQFVVEERA